MADVARWLMERATRAPSPGLEYRDALRLAAQQHEALEHGCWHSNTGAGGYDVAGEHPGRNCMEAEERPDPDDAACPGRCKPCLAIRAAEEFQERYD